MEHVVSHVSWLARIAADVTSLPTKGIIVAHPGIKDQPKRTHLGLALGMGFVRIVMNQKQATKHGWNTGEPMKKYSFIIERQGTFDNEEPCYFAKIVYEDGTFLDRILRIERNCR